MNMRDAVSADRLGFAEAFDENGHQVAVINGPGRYLSERKRNKRWRGSRVTIYNPPLGPGGLLVNMRTKVDSCKLKDCSTTKLAFLEALDWQPREPIDAITRLGEVVNGEKALKLKPSERWVKNPFVTWPPDNF